MFIILTLDFRKVYMLSVLLQCIIIVLPVQKMVHIPRRIFGRRAAPTLSGTYFQAVGTTGHGKMCPRPSLNA